jgi:hypothetical protein
MNEQLLPSKALISPATLKLFIYDIIVFTLYPSSRLMMATENNNIFFLLCCESFPSCCVAGGARPGAGELGAAVQQDGAGPHGGVRRGGPHSHPQVCQLSPSLNFLCCRVLLAFQTDCLRRVR